MNWCGNWPDLAVEFNGKLGVQPAAAQHLKRVLNLFSDRTQKSDQYAHSVVIKHLLHVPHLFHDCIA